MEINQDLIMQFGLMQKLSTGNSMLDAFLVMLLPMLFSRVLPYLQEQLQKWRRRISADMHRREVTHTHKSNRVFDYDEDVPPNHKLQTAILVHLNKLPDFHKKLETADVKLVRAPKQPQQKQKKQQQQQDVQLWDDDACSSDTAESEDACDSWYPDWELERFEINMVPPMDVTVTLEPGLTFLRTQKQNTTAEGTVKTEETTVTFTLESRSAQQIDGFISAAYDSYREAMRKGRESKEDEQRFLYLPVLHGAEASKEGSFTFRAYPLSDGKDFDNFWHPDKDEILRLVDAFRNKTGKFGIKGYPQKLGFLLHGPPGTGKTSFIRALAAHTKRSIINIPLSRIKTNQQLFSLMMDQKIRVEGDDYCRPLPHSKVIYVCEDVDAASHVVQKRGGIDPIAAALSSLAMMPADAHGKPASGQDVAAAGAGQAPASPVAAAGGADISKAQLLGAAMARGRGMRDSGDDELNLAGLLNVLDGVVDTPGRLFVLSSNHPEVLDPALIRPGRINRKVYMGRMAAREALQMVAHYFGDISAQQQEAFAALWRDETVSPAALEALCAECEDVCSLLKGVEVLMTHAIKEEEEGEDEEDGEDVCSTEVACLPFIAQEVLCCAVDQAVAAASSSSPASQAEGLEGCGDDTRLLQDTSIDTS